MGKLYIRQLQEITKIYVTLEQVFLLCFDSSSIIPSRPRCPASSFRLADKFSSPQIWLIQEKTGSWGLSCTAHQGKYKRWFRWCWKNNLHICGRYISMKSVRDICGKILKKKSSIEHLFVPSSFPADQEQTMARDRAIEWSETLDSTHSSHKEKWPPQDLFCMVNNNF